MRTLVSTLIAFSGFEHGFRLRKTEFRAEITRANVV